MDEVKLTSLSMKNIKEFRKLQKSVNKKLIADSYLCPDNKEKLLDKYKIKSQV